MPISESKSSVLADEMEEGTIVGLKSMSSFDVQELDNGFKYLGFFVNPNIIKKMTGSGWLGRWKK